MIHLENLSTRDKNTQQATLRYNSIVQSRKSQGMLRIFQLGVIVHPSTYCSAFHLHNLLEQNSEVFVSCNILSTLSSSRNQTFLLYDCKIGLILHLKTVFIRQCRGIVKGGGQGGAIWAPPNFWNKQKKCVFRKRTIKVCVSCS